MFNPARIVLGGFLGILHDTEPGRLTTSVEGTALRAPFESVSIMRAALGTDILMIGAAELALESLLADPIARGQ